MVVALVLGEVAPHIVTAAAMIAAMAVVGSIIVVNRGTAVELGMVWVDSRLVVPGIGVVEEAAGAETMEADFHWDDRTLHQMTPSC